jgi:hypothetical protein
VPSSVQPNTVTDDVTISITVDARTAAYLRALTRSSSVPDGTLEDVVGHLVHSAADGLRRPGAWERGWVESAFGEFPEGPQTEGVLQYAHREPWAPVHIDEIDGTGDDGIACPQCGSLPIVHAHLTDGFWDCLGCVAGFLDDELRVAPAELAAAVLLAFVQRCCVERADRPRCVDCNGRRNLAEQWVDGKAWLVCPVCLAEHERDFQRCAHCPGTLVFCDVTPDGRVDVAGRLKCNECGTVRGAP